MKIKNNLPNLSGAANPVFKAKYIALNTHIRKDKSTQIHKK